MAITLNSLQSEVGFLINGVSADITACETLVAGVAGKKIKIRHLTINSTDALSIWIGEGAAAGTIDNNLIGPVSFGALQTLQWDFNPLLELTTAYYLLCDAGAAGNVCIFAQGVIQ